jgi:hypothetical protein
MYSRHGCSSGVRIFPAVKFLLGVFRISIPYLFKHVSNRAKCLLSSLAPFVRPSVSTEQPKNCWTNFHGILYVIREFYEKLPSYINLHLDRTFLTTLHEDLHAFLYKSC